MAYSVFSFDSFEIHPDTGEITFNYSADESVFFSPTLKLDLSGVDISKIEGVVFALGMAEIPSFWKATCAPKILIKAGHLDEEQIAFWEHLYKNGLGEFFYTNKIDFRDLLHIEVAGDAPVFSKVETDASERVLVPFGGGKDSLVSGELLKKLGKDFSWFTLEKEKRIPRAEAMMQASGVVDNINIERNPPEYFKDVIELHKKGAPNGHVPITSVYAFAATLISIMRGYGHVALSVERSASEENIEYLGQKINHQYSKSFEFEMLLSAYIKKYVAPIEVFSLLRDKYECQIIEEFARYPVYHDLFLSCNPGLKIEGGAWCGECAKCAFIFGGLSAFLDREEVERIFGKNLFEDESLLQVFKDLIGQGEHKPFDCVGTEHENLLLMYLAKEKYPEDAMPVVLRALDVEAGKQYEYLLEVTTDEHLIPSSFRV